jgi:hypothetical protein
MSICELFNGFKEFKNLRMGFSAIGKGNHSHIVLFDTPLHVDAVKDKRKLPWYKYLKGQ